MSDLSRRPLTKMESPDVIESTEPWTIRCQPRLRAEMREEARLRRQIESEYARDCLTLGHRVYTAMRVGAGYIRVPA